MSVFSAAISAQNHVRAVLVAAVLLSGFSAVRWMQRQTYASLAGPGAVMAVEHSEPLTLEIRVSSLPDESMVEISPEGTGTVHLSLPEQWERREVRGVTLEEVAAEAPMFGYRKWTVPVAATVSFRVPGRLPSLLLQNPTGIPVKVRLTNIDPRAGTTERDVILIDDQAQRLF